MGLLDRFFGPPGKNAFAKKFIEALRKGGIAGPLRYDEKEFQIVLGKDQIYALHNIYQEYCRAKPADRSDVLTRFARAAAPSDVPEDLEKAFPNLVPRLRERFFDHAIRLQFELKGKEPPDTAYVPMAEHYAIELGYDQPDTVALVTTAHLQKWGADLRSLIGRTQKNLEKWTTRRLTQVRPGCYMSDYKDNYDASRALLHEFIRSHPVQGEPVVSTPNRDTLILTGSRDEAGLKLLADRTVAAMGEPRPMCGIPLVLSEGSYAALSPEPDLPAYRELKELCLAAIGSLYKEQSDLLQPLLERKGEDVYVASYGSMENKEKGLVRGWTTWTQGVTTLLPESDLVALVETDAQGGVSKKSNVTLTEWRALQEVAESLMTPTDYYPRRWRVDSFPTRPQLQALAARSPR